MKDMRPASEAESEAYLAGHVTYPGAVETEHGLLMPVSTGAGHLLLLFMEWLGTEGWIKDDLIPQAFDITVADFLDTLY